MQLHIKQPDGSKRLVPLKQNQSLRLGNDPAADVPLVGTDVLPVHCGVLFRDGQFKVFASKAAQQVEVNGQLVPSSPLEEGDQFRLGDVQVSVVSDAFQLQSGGAAKSLSAKPAAAPVVSDELEELEEVDTLDDADELQPLEEADELQPLEDAGGLADLSGGLDPLGSNAGLGGFGMGQTGDLAAGNDLGLGGMGFDGLETGSGLGMPGADLTNMTGAGLGGGMPGATFGQMPGMAGTPDPAMAGAMPGTAAPAAQGTAVPKKPGRLGGILKVVGTLIFLGPAIAVVAVLIANRPTAEQHFVAANELYDAGQPMLAVEAFDLYLSRHPRDARQAEAKVKRQLAQLRPKLTAGGDPFLALAELKQTEQELGPLGRHPVAEEIWSKWGPQIALSLVERAKASTGQADTTRATQSIAQAKAALAWVRQHVPPRVQAERGIDDLDVQLQALDRGQLQADALATAIAAIQQSASASQPADAYSARDKLLEQYPILASQASLVEALSSTAAIEQGRVKVQASGTAATRESAAEPIVLRAILSHTTSDAAVQPGSAMSLPLPEHGVAVGLDTGTGRVLWRRFVGCDGDPLALSLPSAPPALLLFDSNGNELIRAATATGKTEWRLPLDSPSVGGALMGETAFVTTRSGVVWQVDAASGAVAARYELPITASVGPAVDPDGKRLFQAADQAHLFVISPGDTMCSACLYLGHGPGSVSFPPVRMGKYLIVAERDGLYETKLHLVNCQETPRLADQLSVRGAVWTSPIATESTFFMATEDGVVHSFEVSASERKASLKRGPTWAPAVGAGAAAIHLSISKGRLFAAGAGLHGFPLEWRGDQPPAASTLTPAEAIHAGPVVTAGGQSIGIRQRADGGIVVSPIALPVAWETRLAAPSAAGPVAGAEKKSVWTLTRDGDVYKTDITGNSATPAAPVCSVAAPDSGANGWLVFSGSHLTAGQAGAASLSIIDGATDSARSVPMPGRLAGLAAGKTGPIWAALDTGSIVLVDPAAAAIQGTPFLPPWQPGEALGLLGPVALSDGRAVLAMQGKLLLLAAEGSPAAPVARQETPLSATPTALAVLDDCVWITDGQHRAQGWKSEDLSPLGEIVLSSVPIWGPSNVGDGLLMALADGRLMRLGNQPVPVWEASVIQGTVVAAAPLDAQRWLIATRGGWLITLNAASGEVLGEPFNTHQGLSGQLCAAGDRVIVGTNDGCLLELRLAELGTVASAQP
ncbi:MAG: PQQ-binding-like beta-propeller repeat protein [Pirellulales bacterium]